MKYVRIQLNDEISYGIVEGEKVIKINGTNIEECIVVFERISFLLCMSFCK